MSLTLINKELLEDNDCFGCGHVNEHGLKIAVFRDSEDDTRLLGRLDAKTHMTGFPGMMHGGVIYTALDCLSSWVPTILLAEIRAAWVLRSATIKYLRPVLGTKLIDLSAKIEASVPAWQAVSVQAEARNAAGKLLVSGRFKMVPLSLDRFKNVAGLDELPLNWQRLLGETQA
ncbi:MAG: PaaI family thioesterase [Nitrospirae bacterium]|nr:PaaI family thioesterase [Candidatus Manganitrophaceae bacterium]